MPIYHSPAFFICEALQLAGLNWTKNKFVIIIQPTAEFDPKNTRYTPVRDLGHAVLACPDCRAGQRERDAE